MKEIVLSTQVGALTLENCIFNAAGPLCTTQEHLQDLGKSQSSIILTKSCTLLGKEGNPTPRYVETDWGSINSMGLPNLGYEFYIKMAEQMKAYNKPYIISVSGLCYEDNIAIIKAINQVEAVDAIELNLSCPNIPGKPQMAYDFDQMETLLQEIKAINDKPLGVKLPPYFDLVHFQIAATILNRVDLRFVTCINSIGNGLVIDIEKETTVIKPKKGFGGIGGDYVKPTALANVRQFSLLLDESIAVIGCGGIKSGADIFEHILCGADAVQIGTQFMREGPSCFERLTKELKEVMHKKGYTSLADFKGKLKTIE